MAGFEVNEAHKAKPLEKRVLLISLGILIVGCIGYFILSRGTLMFYLLAHLGALGLLGLVGGALGILARKKHRGYWAAFLLGSFLPIALGIMAVVYSGGQFTCGGSVSIAAAILIFVVYLLAKKKIRLSGV
jgi:uncharacterized membrane protein